MGFMEDVNDIYLGFGAAERQGKLLKIQGDIKRLELKLDKCYAELGCEVFADQEIRSYLERSHLEAYTKVSVHCIGGLRTRAEELKRPRTRRKDSSAQAICLPVMRAFGCPHRLVLH